MSPDTPRAPSSETHVGLDCRVPCYSTILRPEISRPGPQPDALASGEGRTPTRAESGGLQVRPPGPARVRPRTAGHGTAAPGSAAGPALPRDRAILVRLARLRVLSLRQLQVLVFPGRDRSRVSRRISALEKSGWLRRWEEPRERGGRPRLVVPTVAGLAWALRRLEGAAEEFAHARLLTTMLRTNRTAPITLPPGRIPAFLPHLAEVNAALVSLLGAERLHVSWASSWPRPFPTGDAFGLRLPQPDGVLLLAPPVGPTRLVFLEHDRATESLVSFARTKVDRYRALASRPALLEELTGHRTFSVVVTVAGADERDAERRLVSLGRLVRLRFASRLATVVPYRDLLERPEAILSALGPGVPPRAQPDAEGPSAG